MTDRKEIVNASNELGVIAACSMLLSEIEHEDIGSVLLLLEKIGCDIAVPVNEFLENQTND